MKYPSRVLDLFCGAGGFSLGFRSAGFEIVAGIDNDSQALTTYAKNFPEAIALNLNLAHPEDLWLGQLDVLGKIDGIIGGPPCQGFSIAGKRLIDDPRNYLYRAYIAVVKRIKPTWIAIENVPTIRTMGEGKVFSSIIDDLNQLGYSTSSETLNSSKFGVPQNRRRTFILGRLSQWGYQFPEALSLSPITSSDAISDLPSLSDEPGSDVMTYSSMPVNAYQSKMRDGSKDIRNHWAVAHTETTKRIISMVPDGGNYKDLPENLWSTRKVNIAWTRLNSKRPSFTIDAGHNHHFHYKENRVPTVRECARIQSFPDTFVFLGNKTSQFRQVGNAVPPLLAEAVAIAIREQS